MIKTCLATIIVFLFWLFSSFFFFLFPVIFTYCVIHKPPLRSQPPLSLPIPRFWPKVWHMGQVVCVRSTKSVLCQAKTLPPTLGLKFHKSLIPMPWVFACHCMVCVLLCVHSHCFACSCVDITEQQASLIDKYHCPKCALHHEPIKCTYAA